jgi:hypothetical protein
MTAAVFGWRVKEGDDAIHVGDVAEGEDIGQVCAGDGGHDGLCPLAQDELVVGKIFFRTVAAANPDSLAGRLMERTSWFTWTWTASEPTSFPAS